VSGYTFGGAVNGSARKRCSTTWPMASIQAARSPCRAAISAVPIRSSGPGTSGIGRECSATGFSPAWKSAVSEKIATSSPLRSCQATTRRVVNDRPSRMRSTA
jgi:hypothetical protein